MAMMVTQKTLNAALMSSLLIVAPRLASARRRKSRVGGLPPVDRFGGTRLAPRAGKSLASAHRSWCLHRPPSVEPALQDDGSRDLIDHALAALAREVGLDEDRFGLDGGEALVDRLDRKAGRAERL